MLKGKNIYLRTIEPTDAAIMLQWENNTDNWAVSNTLVPFSEHLILHYVNSAQDIFETKQLRFIICLSANHKPIGTIDLFEYDPLHRRAGLGVLIDEVSERNKGYADEALKLMIQYSWDRLNLHGLFCNIFESNEYSIKLFEKNGFEKTGAKKDWVKMRGNWETELFFQLMNKNDLAIKHGEFACEINPLYPTYQLWLSWIHQFIGNTDIALKEANKLLKVESNFTFAHYIIGNCYYDQGNYEKALLEYEKIDFKNDFILSVIGHVHASLGQKEKALKVKTSMLLFYMLFVYPLGNINVN